MLIFPDLPDIEVEAIEEAEEITPVHWKGRSIA
jgi:hypothetical protein